MPGATPYERAVRSTLKNYRDLENQAIGMASLILEIQRPGRKPGSLFRIEFDEDAQQVTAAWTDFCMGSADDDCIVWPLSYMWDEDFFKVEKARVEAEKARKAQEQQAQTTQQEDRDRALYQRLKKRFEPEVVAS